jgi:hypothetical protein
MKYKTLLVSIYFFFLLALPTIQLVKSKLGCHESCCAIQKSESSKGCSKEKCIIHFSYNSGSFLNAPTQQISSIIFLDLQDRKTLNYEKKLVPNYTYTIWHPPKANFIYSRA